jgi:hypothetical protein
MKTFRHLWQYFAEFFLKLEMFQIKAVEEFKNTDFVFSIFFRKSCRLWDNVEKYSGARGRTWQYGGALRAGLVRLHARKHSPAPVLPPTHTHKDVILLFHDNNGFVNTTNCYVIRTLPILLTSALDRLEWSHAPSALPPVKDFSSHWIWGWMGPRVGLDVSAKILILLLPEFGPRFVHSIAGGTLCYHYACMFNFSVNGDHMCCNAFFLFVSGMHCLENQATASGKSVWPMFCS